MLIQAIIIFYLLLFVGALLMATFGYLLSVVRHMPQLLFDFLSWLAIIPIFVYFICTGIAPKGTTPHPYYKQYPWMRKTLAVVLTLNAFAWSLIAVA